jgi:CRISPR-associated protein Csm3
MANNEVLPKTITLIKILRLSGQIEVMEQLLIGGSDETFTIGNAVDRSFIRDPIYGYPYIPGSSLKGKLRCCLEEITPGAIIGDEPHKCRNANCKICRLFGPHKLSNHDFGPSRLIVRDAGFSEESIEKMKKVQLEGKPYFGIKTENLINRRTRAALTPRKFEPVPKEAKFDFEILLRIYEVDKIKDKDEELKKFVIEGIRLIEKSYLGGNGSRGYGKVIFHENPWDTIYELV